MKTTKNTSNYLKIKDIIKRQQKLQTKTTMNGKYITWEIGVGVSLQFK